MALSEDKQLNHLSRNNWLLTDVLDILYMSYFKVDDNRYVNNSNAVFYPWHIFQTLCLALLLRYAHAHTEIALHTGAHSNTSALLSNSTLQAKSESVLKA